MNQTLLRSILKIGAGALVAKGLTDESTAETIIAAVLALIGVVWGLAHRTPPPPGVPVEIPVRRTTAPAVALVFGVCCLVFANGCATGSTTKLINALAKDPACVSAEVVTPWGHARVTRVGPQTNTVNITAAGADVNKEAVRVVNPTP